ncbi:MAG: flagellar protein FlaG [Desulfobacterium sp.]|nr:flagellar protein FlaG [Desulfobacterium sp.]
MNTNGTATKEHISSLSPPSSLYLNGSEQVNVSERVNDSEKVTASEKTAEIKKSQQTGNKIVSKEEADEIVETLYELTEMLQTSITFQVDKGTDSVVIKVIDKKTDELIRQIPNKEILKLREKMKEMTGLLLSESV